MKPGDARKSVPVTSSWHEIMARSHLRLAGGHVAFGRPGGHGGVAAPVPIPNTAVKRPSADGTSSQDAGE